MAVVRVSNADASLAAAGGAVLLGAGLSHLAVGVVRTESAVCPCAVGTFAGRVLALGLTLGDGAERLAVAGLGAVLLHAFSRGCALEGTVTGGSSLLVTVSAAAHIG